MSRHFGSLGNVPLGPPQQRHAHMPSENGMKFPNLWDVVFEALL